MFPSDPTDPILIFQRFVLMWFGSAVVVLDISTGAFYTPNPTVLALLAVLAEGGTIDDATRRVAETTRTHAGVVRADLDALLAELDRVSVGQQRRVEPFCFRESSAGLSLVRGGQELVRVGPDGRRLERLYDRRDTTVDPAAVLTFVAPQALALQGLPMLHAAAVRRGKGLIALLGPSGAGKTTTAHALATEDATPVSVDLLPVEAVGSRLAAFSGGEAAITAWATDAAQALTSGMGTVDTHPLAQAVRAGASMRIDEVWLVDPQRCGGETLQVRQLAPARAFTKVLAVGLGAPHAERDGLLRHLGVASRLVRSCTVSQVATPAGQGTLRHALRSHHRDPSVRASDGVTRREFLGASVPRATVALAALAILTGYVPPALAWTGEVLAQPGGGSGGCPFPNPRNPNCMQNGTPRRRAFARFAPAVVRRAAKEWG